jgi:transcriptional regulator with XRE-family HTH domain
MATATLTKRPLQRRTRKPLLIVKPKVSVSDAVAVKQLRLLLKMPRPIFARLMGCSERALANWETGRPIQDIYKSRLNELRKLHDELAEVTEPESIGAWFTAPNEEFGGMKPIELIERGEMFRIWRMVFFLKSGTPL